MIKPSIYLKDMKIFHMKFTHKFTQMFMIVIFIMFKVGKNTNIHQMVSTK